MIPLQATFTVLTGHNPTSLQAKGPKSTSFHTSLMRSEWSKLASLAQTS